MCSEKSDRGFFEDLAVSFKECCGRHDIDLKQAEVEFDEFLDDMDKCVTEFLDEVGELLQTVQTGEENDDVDEEGETDNDSSIKDPKPRTDDRVVTE